MVPSKGSDGRCPGGLLNEDSGTEIFHASVYHSNSPGEVRPPRRWAESDTRSWQIRCYPDGKNPFPDKLVELTIWSDSYIGILFIWWDCWCRHAWTSAIYAAVRIFISRGNWNLFLGSYVNLDRNITKRIIQHAEKRGVKGLFITVDAPQLGRREKVGVLHVSSPI